MHWYEESEILYIPGVMHVFVKIERIYSVWLFKFLQMFYGKCSQTTRLYYIYVTDIIKKPHINFKSSSIFKTYYILKITENTLETYSMKHSHILGVSKAIPPSESHCNGELGLESIFTDGENVIFFISIADLYWIFIYCITAYVFT